MKKREKEIIMECRKILDSELEYHYGSTSYQYTYKLENTIEEAAALNNEYSIKVNFKSIVVAVLLHEFFKKEDNENYHNLAADYTLENKSLFSSLFHLSEQHIEGIAKAVREHRGQHNNKYSNSLSLLLATVKKYRPEVELDYEIMQQIRSTTLANPEMDRLGVIEKIRKYIIEKYKEENWHINFPSLYLLKYEKEMEKIKSKIDYFKDEDNFASQFYNPKDDHVARALEKAWEKSLGRKL